MRQDHEKSRTTWGQVSGFQNTSGKANYTHQDRGGKRHALIDPQIVEV